MSRTAWIGTLAAVVALAPAMLAAQKLTDPMLPLPETSRRHRELEKPASPGGIYEVWTVGAPPEMMLGWYLRKLNRLSPVKDGNLDRANVILGDTRPPMSYHITLHTFDDECMDSAQTGGASGGTASCTRMRLGKQKRTTLDNNRVSFEMGEWIDKITFSWYVREATGPLVRREIELRDTGLSNDWKRYTLITQITLKREVVDSAPAPSP
jgi:hypothetical protein